MTSKEFQQLQDNVRGTKINLDKKESTKAANVPHNACQTRKKGIVQQLVTSAAMDAISCFCLSDKFEYVHYGDCYIRAKHISGITIEITIEITIQ